MKPTSKTSNYIVVLCGLLISFAFFAANLQNKSEGKSIRIDRQIHQPAVHKSTQGSPQIVEKKSQDHVNNKKQPPLNIVASFIFIEAKSSNQDTEENDDNNTTQYKRIIHSFIKAIF